MNPPGASQLLLLKACHKSRVLPPAHHVYSHVRRHPAKLTDLQAHGPVLTPRMHSAIDDAHQMSLCLHHRPASFWQAMIAGYVERSQCWEALAMYRLMQEDGVIPDLHTFVSLLRACTNVADISQAEKLHNDVRRHGLASDVYVGTTLVSMYGKLGEISKAEHVFDRLYLRNVVSWNAMLSAYMEQGLEKEALLLFRQMLDERLGLTQQTFMIILQACWTMVEKQETMGVEGELVRHSFFDIGKALHADAARHGLVSNVCVGSALVSMYGKCQQTADAENVFNVISECNSVTWCAMLWAYVEAGSGERALQLYKQIQVEGTAINSWMLVSALQACGNLIGVETADSEEGGMMKEAASNIAEALHADAQKMGLVSSAFVASCLLTLYTKLGSIEEVENVFCRLPQHHDVVLWNAMLSANVGLGQSKKALQLYSCMQEEDIAVDVVTMICASQACCEAGTVEISRQIHFNVIFAGYDAIPLLLNTLIRAYGCCACMEDAEVIFDGLSQTNVVSWNACITGYAQAANIGATLKMLEEMSLTGAAPNDVTFLAVLCACNHASLVNDGFDYFGCMRHYDITPKVKHYVAITDLLGRVGDFERLEYLILGMPVQADAVLWLRLLGACKLHGYVDLGRRAFDCVVGLDSKDATAYIFMSNIYFNAGMMECANEVERLREKEGAWRFRETWLKLD